MLARNAGEDGPWSLIEGQSPLEAVVEAGLFEAVGSEALRNIVEFKWRQFALRFFLLELLVYSVFVAIFTAAAVESGPTRETSEGWLSVFGYCAAGSVLYLLISLRAMTKLRGPLGRRLFNYLVSVWKMIEFGAHGCVITAFVLRVSLASDQLQLGFTATAAVLLWLRFLAFARGFRATGRFVRTVIRIMQSIAAFVVVLLFVVLGFAVAFHVLFQGTEALELKPFRRWEVLLKTYAAIFGEFDFAEMGEARVPWLSRLLMVGYSFLVGIVLLNLLIALMADVYSSVERNAESEWLLERAKIVLQVERPLPWSYITPANFPLFLHVLRPRDLDTAPPPSSEMRAVDAPTGDPALHKLQADVAELAASQRRIADALAQMRA